MATAETLTVRSKEAGSALMALISSRTLALNYVATASTTASTSETTATISTETGEVKTAQSSIQTLRSGCDQAETGKPLTSATSGEAMASGTKTLGCTTQEETYSGCRK